MQIYIALFALVMVSSSMLAFAETGNNVTASGYILSYNNSTHAGLWAATADLLESKGDLISVFKNDAGDILVVTVRGDKITVDEDNLTIVGTGFVAKNSVLLREGNGTAIINNDTVEVRVNGDIVISGKTVSFETT
ncbi:MAG: hypothetical protein QXU32_12310 [Nitrososphaerales archaeon]